MRSIERWTLPLVVDPPERLCVLVDVPNDEYHIAAFLGAIYTLTWSQSWQRDETHKAALVSRVWTSIFDSLRLQMCADFDCPIAIEECEVEMSLCDNLRFANGKLQVLCCGQWVNVDGQPSQGVGAPGQPGTGQPIAAPGQCASYHAGITAKNAWSAPFVVSAGDTITFSNPAGAWSDGAGGPVSTWWLPSGNVYFAGLDVGSPTHDMTDPDATLFHMQLAAIIAGVYYPADSGTITVPGGISNEPLTLVANDGTLSDNFGSVAVDLNYCNNAAIVGTYMTVDHGSLSSRQVHIGDVIVINSVFGGGFYQVEVEFDLTTNHVTPSAMQYNFLLTGAYTPCATGGCTPWAYIDEGASEVFGTPGTPWPGRPPGTWVSLLAFNSDSPFTLSFTVAALRAAG